MTNIFQLLYACREVSEVFSSDDDDDDDDDDDHDNNHDHDHAGK